MCSDGRQVTEASQLHLATRQLGDPSSAQSINHVALFSEQASTRTSNRIQVSQHPTAPVRPRKQPWLFSRDWPRLAAPLCPRHVSPCAQSPHQKRVWSSPEDCGEPACGRHQQMLSPLTHPRFQATDGQMEMARPAPSGVVLSLFMWLSTAKVTAIIL